MNIAFPFNDFTTATFDDIKSSKAVVLKMKLISGEKLTRDEKNWITARVNDNVFSKFGIPVLGWMVSFHDYLRHFIVFQHGRIYAIHAFDKTALRNVVYGRIDKIVEYKD